MRSRCECSVAGRWRGGQARTRCHPFSRAICSDSKSAALHTTATIFSGAVQIGAAFSSSGCVCCRTSSVYVPDLNSAAYPLPCTTASRPSDTPNEMALTKLSSPFHPILSFSSSLVSCRICRCVPGTIPSAIRERLLRRMGVLYPPLIPPEVRRMMPICNSAPSVSPPAASILSSACSIVLPARAGGAPSASGRR